MLNLSAAAMAANNLINEYGRISADELAKLLEINVWERGFKKQNGAYYLVENKPYVFINNSLSYEMHNIVLLHEIGHDRLHRDNLKDRSVLVESSNMFDPKNDIMEHEANLFVAEYILSDEDILECVECGYSIKQAAAELNTDENLVALKIEEMNKRGYSLNVPDYEINFLKAN